MEKIFLRKVEILHDEIENHEIYPFNIPVIKNTQYIEFNKPITILVGENGKGKSTLIESIAVAMKINPEGGSQNFNFATQNTHSNLHQYIRLTKGIDFPVTKYFLRAETFYNVATETDQNFDALRAINFETLHSRSHGESFITLIKNRFYNNGFYLLDEPESGLSPSSLLKLLKIIDDMAKHGCQIIMATHSPILMAVPNAQILEIGEEINNISYENISHVDLYKRFLNNREDILRNILN